MAIAEANSKTVARYGAALSTAVLATGVDAAVIDLNFNQTVFNPGFTTMTATGTGSGFSVRFAVLNATSSRGLFGFSVIDNNAPNFSTFVDFAVVDSNIASITSQQPFTTSLLNFLPFSSSADPLFVGMKTGDNKLGFLKFKFAANGAATILEGKLETIPGLAILKDTTPIPVPAALPMMAGGLLAMGAVGLRRRRKKQKAA